MKKFVLAVVVLAVLAGAGFFGFKLWRDQQVGEFARTEFGQPGTVVVNIPSGSGPRAVSQLLADNGVVADAEKTYGYLRKQNLAAKLRAGEYEFTLPTTPVDAIGLVTSGRTKTYRVTIPEGLRVDEVVPRLVASELKLDEEKLNAILKDRAWLTKQGVPSSPSGVEGFLYPDTYTFARPFNEQAVVAKMISRTLEEYRKADTERKDGVKLDLLQTMTLASIVEKETGRAEERPRISCVFHNRLRQGIPLATDPTVLYAAMLMRGHFVKNITRKDLETPHPYNTYRVKGLPPGPIAGAGSAAIRAALNPLDCNDLFFVSRNDGTHVFCPNLKCHEAAVEEWQRKYFRKQRRGG